MIERPQSRSRPVAVFFYAVRVLPVTVLFYDSDQRGFGNRVGLNQEIVCPNPLLLI